jgi:hypothetical protein
MLKLRSTILTVFCAYVASALAGMALYGMGDDSPFVPAMQAHLELKLAWLAVAGGEALAGIAIALGGIPLTLSVLRQALFKGRRDLPILLAVPFVALGALVLLGGAVALAVTALGGNNAPLFVLRGGSIFLTLAFIAAAIISTGAICFAVSRSDTRRAVRLPFLKVTVQPLSFTRLPALVATAGMSVALTGIVGWWLFAALDASAAFNSSAGLWDTPPPVSLLVIALVMLVSALASIRASLSGLAVPQNPV